MKVPKTPLSLALPPSFPEIGLFEMQGKENAVVYYTRILDRKLQFSVFKSSLLGSLFRFKLIDFN